MNTEPTVKSEDRLLRVIGPWTLAANAINLTLGAGIFVLPATAAGIMGPSAVFGYLLCGLTIGLVLACFAEVGSRVSASGGTYAYVEAAFGPLPAFLVGTLLWFGYAAAADAAIAHIWFDNLAELLPSLRDPWLRRLLIAGLIAALAGINIRGVRQGVRLAAGLTVAKLFPLLILLAVGLPAAFKPWVAAAETPSPRQLGEGAVVLFFAFAGAECALTPSGEILQPRRTVPLALLIAVGALLFLFVGLQIVAQGVLGANLASHPAPLAAAAQELLGPAGRWLLVVGALISTLGTLAGDILATPRAVYASAIDGVLPKKLGGVSSRFHTPASAIVLFGAVVCGFAWTGAFRDLAILSSAAVLVIYLAVCLASLRLRYRWKDEGFRMPGGPLVAILATACVSWLLWQLSPREWLALGAFAGVALVIYALRRQ